LGLVFEIVCFGAIIVGEPAPTNLSITNYELPIIQNNPDRYKKLSIRA